MKRKIFAVLMMVTLLSSFLVVTGPAVAEKPSPVTPPPVFPRTRMAPPGPDMMDGTYLLGEEEMALRKHAARVGPAVATGASPSGQPATIGEELTLDVSDYGLNIDYSETFVVVMDGTHGIILVEKAAYDNYDAVTDEYVFANPNACWRDEDRISTTQLAYLLDQFDTVMYSTVATVYGEPLPRGDEGQKVWILIFNIRDESYYDCTQTTFVGGYFSSSESMDNNKNIMHIDTFDWTNRTGPGVDRPYGYEITFAHEFEHLVHFDADPDEESWVDEGMADLAGFFCGYGHMGSHLAYYMVYHPFTALTFWGNALEDYGASYLFALYMYEKFGGAPFVSAWFDNPLNGIEGVEDTLFAFGYPDTFDEIFDDWTIANYLDDTRVNDRYGYENVDIGGIDTWGYSIEFALQDPQFYGIDPFEPVTGLYSSWFFGAPQPYTSHYYRFGGQPTLRTALEGDLLAGTPAYSGDWEWYSGMETWAWRSFNQTFTLPMTDTLTLNFMTFYEIEEDWDYGYVEVYDQDTGEWYTLDDPSLPRCTDDYDSCMVDYVAFAQDNPNTPDGREPTDYEDAGRWHAFTGYSNGWLPVSMDLTSFAGHTIDLYFRSWQDGAFTLQMMYIDDIEIAEIGFFDDVEADEDGWTADGWYRTTGVLPNNWQATLIETLWQPTKRYAPDQTWRARQLLDETRMVMDPETQSGEITDIPTTPASSRRTQVLIVSNRSDHILTADYWVEFTN